MAGFTCHAPGCASMGLDIEAWLANPGEHPAIRMAAERLLAESERLYRRAETGIALLPPDCRPRHPGGPPDLCRNRPRGAGPASRPAVAPGYRARFRKWQLLLGAFRRLPDEAPGRRQPAPPVLNAAQFLMVGLPEPAHATGNPGLAWWDLSGRLITILPIIEKLERSERGLALPGTHSANLRRDGQQAQRNAVRFGESDCAQPRRGMRKGSMACTIGS